MLIIIGLIQCSLVNSLLGYNTDGKSPPNIVVIFTDDQGYADLGSQEIVDDIRTPAIDQLAREGVQFTSGYVTAPMCAPSRAGLLLGRYQQRIGLETNFDLPVKLNLTTLPQRLKACGYRTGMVGKLHLPVQREDNPQKGIEDPRLWGFDEFNMKAGNLNVSPTKRLTTHNRDQSLIPDGPEWQEWGGYRIGVSTEAALGFIERNHDQPFFLYLAYFAPHVPLEAPLETLSSFDPNLPPARRMALAMMAEVDSGVTAIRKQLDKFGLTNDTLIFYISDNGAPLEDDATQMHQPITELKRWDGSLNLPLLGQKGILAEGGIRVPFIACWPGTIPKGQVIYQPVSTLDIAATVAPLAGAGLDNLDGIDLMPLLTGKREIQQRPPLFWRLGGQYAVRTNKWKFLKSGDNRYLFEMDVPIAKLERKNQILDYPHIATALEAKLDRWLPKASQRGIVRTKQLQHENKLIERTYPAAPGIRQLQLIPDRFFEYGFSVKDVDGKAAGKLIQNAEVHMDPLWQISQWHCRSDLLDGRYKELPGGGVEWSTPEKSLRVWPDSHPKHGIELELNSRVTYNDRYRDGKTKDWPHFLLNARISGPGGWKSDTAPTLAEMLRLDLKISAQLIQEEHVHSMLNGYNPKRHAAQFVLYFTVQCLDKDDPDNRNFLWFGVGLYDDRYPEITLRTKHDNATRKLIYNIGINSLDPDISLHDGKLHTVEGDLLPHVLKAIQVAQEKGYFKTEDLSKFRIGGLNFGWEIPGLSHASVHVRDLSLVATY